MHNLFVPCSLARSNGSNYNINTASREDTPTMNAWLPKKMYVGSLFISIENILLFVVDNWFIFIYYKSLGPIILV